MYLTVQVTLAAAGASGTKAKVMVKSPAFGAAGGANLVQTIFSDYAPSLMPVDAVSEATHSSSIFVHSKPAGSQKCLLHCV
jgi:hypothetical protein